MECYDTRERSLCVPTKNLRLVCIPALYEIDVRVKY